MQVAAPKPIPAGFQIQIYDLAGFKLSYVMGDMFSLFKVCTSGKCSLALRQHRQAAVAGALNFRNTAGLGMMPPTDWHHAQPLQGFVRL